MILTPAEQQIVRQATPPLSFNTMRVKVTDSGVFYTVKPQTMVIVGHADGRTEWKKTQKLVGYNDDDLVHADIKAPLTDIQRESILMSDSFKQPNCMMFKLPPNSFKIAWLYVKIEDVMVHLAPSGETLVPITTPFGPASPIGAVL